MRLTNNIIMRNYISHLNKSKTTLDKLTEKATTQRLYMHAYENPTAALKAFNVRRDLSRISIYKDNILDIQNNLTDIEAAISSLNDIAIEVNAQVIQGQNTTYGKTQREAIAEVLRGMQQQVLNNANASYGGRFLFGGSNVKDTPFVVNEEGKLLYNGVDVDTGTFSGDSLYVDIGLGLSTGTLNSNSAYDMAYPGNKLLGSGVDENGVSNNLYNLIGQIAEKFENNDLTDIEKYTDKLKEKMDNIVVQYADIGEKTKFVEFVNSKIEIDEENSLLKQEKIETADLAQAITDFLYQDMSYNAALQIGAKVLSNSLLDYLR